MESIDAAKVTSSIRRLDGIACASASSRLASSREAVHGGSITNGRTGGGPAITSATALRIMRRAAAGATVIDDSCAMSSFTASVVSSGPSRAAASSQAQRPPVTSQTGTPWQPAIRAIMPISPRVMPLTLKRFQTAELIVWASRPSGVPAMEW